VKPVFSAAMGATPYKKDFYAKMGERREDVDGRLEGWLGSLEMQVGVLKGFLGRKEAKWWVRAEGERREDVDGRLEGWLGSLEMQVRVLKGFLGRKEAKW